MPGSTTTIRLDPDNPRQISPQAAVGLGHSLSEFGDLSGIVWNSRTEELVAGHRRLEQIRRRWGERSIEPINESLGLYGIKIDEGRYFPVRVVDWSRARQRAANVAANADTIRGEFTADVSDYLMSVADEIKSESPSLLDDLLLATYLEEPDESVELKEVKIMKPPRMSWCLIGLETTQWGQVSEIMEALAAIPGIILETTSNDG